ncbi:MAG: hypothetical protein V7K54_28650 [Nostoc sp.]
MTIEDWALGIGNCYSLFPIPHLLTTVLRKTVTFLMHGNALTLHRQALTMQPMH